MNYEKLNDPTVMSVFQATIGGRFAPLVTLVDEDADLDSMVTHSNKAVTDTAAELLGKQLRKRKPWVTPLIVDLCDQRRDLTKKRGEAEKQGKPTIIQDKSGKCLTEENEILNRWTEYCSDLYNYETDGDPIVLDCPQILDEEHHPILREEVEAAVKALKMGKSAGVDNIPAKLVQAGGEAMIDILTSICNTIWKTGEWPTTWTQSLVITLPKKGNLRLCQNYRTISIISHSSKVMLKIILNRLQPQAEEIIAEEQAGFRAERSTTEQIFNLRILGEKYLQHQKNLYRVLIDFKKAFDRVWHEALWATMRKYINATSYEPLKICMTRPRVQSYSMAAQENGSELQQEFDKGVYSHQLSLTSS